MILLVLIGSVRKKPVNLTLTETVVEQSKQFTDNLSGTVEVLLAQFVEQQRSEQTAKYELSKTYCADWNAVLNTVGSFADEHSTL